ncbi:helix-turn-helix transcriptional regulator [Sinorhizobium fredii]|uniref:helix-turn-helix transcriptional regulator n=1 Tax=Rhizobium fredii TaxID=380 RepID=UPI000CF2C0B1|nr:AlpA family phage regulatory protein [Sinorhizobium fredii]
MNETTEPQRVLRESELPVLDGLRKTQRAELIRRGLYPAPVRISDRRKVWLAHEIADWQQARISARDTKGAL